MLKKFLAGAIAVLGLGVFLTASAAYDFGTTTLKIGSKGEAVKSVQTVVGATPVDGIFGKMTAAKVKVWQKANGLVADGVFGAKSKAVANGGSAVSTTTTTTTSTKVSGGAGDATMSHYSTSEKSKIGEGDKDIKVLGFKVEADDSDIAVNSVKVAVENTNNASSYKITKYLDSVDIYKGSEKVGSADASDFSKDSSDVYTKSISLKNAVVKEGDKDAFYVAFNAVDSIDTDNEDFNLKVSIDSYRFTDGTGVVMSGDEMSDYNNVTFDSTSDSMDLKSSSNNPDDETITVKESDTSDETLALAFKLKVDDDSSDVTLDKLPIVVKIAGAGASVTSSESVIDSVTVKIDGDEYEADATNTSIDNAGSDTATYTVDLDDEDVVVKSGDTAEVKVYITFAEQKDNYANSTVVTASIAKAGIDAETDDSDNITLGGSDQTGADLTLNTSAVTLSKVSWTATSGASAGVIDLFFTLEAGDDDLTGFTVAGVVQDGTHNTTGVLTQITGDATEPTTGTFSLSSGDTANFRVRYTATDGSEVKVKTIAGQTVANDKQLSPTVIFQ